jgi:hypothetical protein
MPMSYQIVDHKDREMHWAAVIDEEDHVRLWISIKGTEIDYKLPLTKANGCKEAKSVARMLRHTADEIEELIKQFHAVEETNG